MRVQCKQCGQSIYSRTCQQYCDPKIREEQLDSLAKWIDEQREKGINIIA